MSQWPVQLAAIRRERETSTPISVLVGVDGSVEAGAAACTVVELFGPRLGHLMLAAVIDFDAAESARRRTGSVECGSPRSARGPRHLCRGFRSRHDRARRRTSRHPARIPRVDHDIDLLAVGTHRARSQQSGARKRVRPTRAATGSAGPRRRIRNAEKHADEVWFGLGRVRYALRQASEKSRSTGFGTKDPRCDGGDAQTATTRCGHAREVPYGRCATDRPVA